MKTGTLAIANVRRDGGTQIRAALDENTVLEYTALIQAGVKLPPVGVYQDGPLSRGTKFWLWDGFHRIEAHARAGATRIEVEFRDGTLDDAILAACAANQAHGLRRTNADKRRAVETMLAHPIAKDWSARRIADHIGVTHAMVAEHRVKVSTVDTLSCVKEQDIKDLRRETPRDEGLADGDEGAGDGCITVHDQVPAPDEPAIDMLGLKAPADWLEGVAALLAGLERINGALTALVGAAGSIGGPPPVVQAARQAVQQAGASVRALAPVMACVYCKDPGGGAGRRVKCSACGDLGWLTKEQAARVPPAMAKAS